MGETPNRPPAIRDGPAGASAYDDTNHNGLLRNGGRKGSGLRETTPDPVALSPPAQALFLVASGV